MKFTRVVLPALSVVIGIMLVSKAVAAPFEAAFKLTKINGECSVMTPDSKKFITADEGKAYPYGSKIKTGTRKSSVVIEFSSGNICRVLANTVLAVTEDAKDRKLKTLKLDEGEVGVELEEKFHENNSLDVETAAGICGAIGCKFRVKSSRESELKVIVIFCEDGKIRVHGPDFEIPLIEKEMGLSISKADDKDFTRLKNIKGIYVVNLLAKDAQGNPVKLELKTGYSIKIYREISPTGNMLVYLLVLSPEGKTEATYTYNRPLDTKPDLDKKDDKGKKDNGNGEITPFPPMSTTTTTTISTTTTTLPPKDLISVTQGGEAGSTPTTTTPSVPSSSQPAPAPTPTPVGSR